MNKVLPLFHSDLFVKENVGTEAQITDLKNQILQAKKDDRGTQGGSNPGCWRSTALYEMKWLYDEMKNLVMEANQNYFERDSVFELNHLQLIRNQHRFLLQLRKTKQVLASRTMLHLLY